MLVGLKKKSQSN
jgi:hypothetical protein